MAYEAQCPKGHRLQVTEAHFRQTVNCPTCNTPFVVPDLSVAAHPAPSAAAHAAPVMDAPVITPKRPRIALGSFSDLAGKYGRPMLAIGLIAVVFARGCDAIGQRSIASAKLEVDAAELKAGFPVVKKLMSCQTQIADLKEQKLEKDADTSAIDKKIKELTEKEEGLQKDVRKAKKDFENNQKPDLQYAANIITARNAWWGYWREWMFVVGVVVLVLGLVSTSSVAQGAERWVCLIMLAILTFSIFIYNAGVWNGARGGGLAQSGGSNIVEGISAADVQDILEKVSTKTRP